MVFQRWAGGATSWSDRLSGRADAEQKVPPERLGEYPARGRMYSEVESERFRPFGWEWRRARRGRLRFDAEGLQFEEWFIPYAYIDEAVVLTPADFPALALLFTVFRIRTRGIVYEFLVGRFWVSDAALPFPVKREQTLVLPKAVVVLLALALLALLVLLGYLWE